MKHTRDFRIYVWRLLCSLLVLTWQLPVNQAMAAGTLPLWELSGTDNRIMLMGSIHFLRPEDYPLPPSLQRAYEDADILYMEIDTDDLNPMLASMIMVELGTDPQGRSLQDLMGAGGYRQARQKAEALSLDLALVDAHEPWFAALLLTQVRLMMLGFDASYGVEHRFMLKARSDGKEIRGLETIEEQLAALDDLPLQVQRDFLLQTLDEAANVGDQIADIVSAWKSGDTHSLEKSQLESLKTLPEVYEGLLVKRNRNWSKTIIDLTDDPHDYLIVVGALHLVGKDSVLRMLEDAGYPSRQF